MVSKLLHQQIKASNKGGLIILERPKCQVKEHWPGGGMCHKPAKFVKRAPAGTWIVCGMCARKYLAACLSPFRMKDWPEIQKEIDPN